MVLTTGCCYHHSHIYRFPHTKGKYSKGQVTIGRLEFSLKMISSTDLSLDIHTADSIITVIVVLGKLCEKQLNSNNTAGF